MKSKFSRILGVSLSVVMLTSMLVTAAPALANVSSASVTVSPTTISQNAVYTIQFTTGASLVTGGNISLSFPSDTTIQNGSLNSSVLVAGDTGLLGTTFVTANFSGVNVTATGRVIVISLNGTDHRVGSGALVVVQIPTVFITNPSGAGSYSLNVSTSNETTAVASALYTITLPVIGALPGTITGKNAAGQILYQTISGDINPAIATTGVKTIELGPGTFNVTVNANVTGQTIVGTGAAGTVILAPSPGNLALSITAINVTIQGIVINAENSSTLSGVEVTGTNGLGSVFKNCTFNGGVNQLNVNLTGNTSLVYDCIFNVTGNVTAGINTNVRLTTNSTFNVDDGGTAIIATAGGLSITNAKFNGTLGTGAGIVMTYTTGNRSSSITGATFSNLGNNALSNTGGNSTVTVKESTFTGSGNTSTTAGVIFNTGDNNTDGLLVLVNNTISNSVATAYAIQVSGGNVTARFNSIINTLNVRRSGGTASFTNNWWGTNNGATGTSGSSITTDPHLDAITTNGILTLGLTSNTSITGVVDVATSNGTVGAVGLAKYASNPQSVAPNGTPIAYYDVFVNSPAEGSTITIRFYGAVTENTKVLYGGGLSGAWSLAGTQGVNVPSGYAWITINAASMPSFVDMAGTPFVITNVLSMPAAPVLAGPAAGTTGVPTNTGFSWSAATDARYDFQLSTSPTFATLTANVSNLSTNVYGGVTLAANTTYFWRVRSMVGMGSAMQMTAWTVSTFTTAAPAAAATLPPITISPPPPAQVTVQAPPPAQVTVTAPTVNVAAPPAPVVNVTNTPAAPIIPNYILWTIILIGAVLIIALIVLIVRTRRVA